MNAFTFPATRKRSAERDEFLADVLSCAVEGGVSYWARSQAYHWRFAEGDAHAVAYVELFETEDLEQDPENPWGVIVPDGLAPHVVTLDTIATGFGRIARGEVQIRDDLRKRYTEASRENEAGDIDAGDADNIVQAALFGELVYG